MNPGSFGTLDMFCDDYIFSYLMCKFYRKMQGGSLKQVGNLFLYNDFNS